MTKRFGFANVGLAELGLSLAALSAQAQAPVPAPHPTPQPAPAANVLFEDYTLPALGPYIDALGRIGGALRMPLISTYTGILGGFAAVHDGRRKALEEARTKANAAMDRELRAAGITNFRLDSCLANPSSCADLQGRFSAETHASIQRYFDTGDRYIAWSDLGNVTGRGWTHAERQAFIGQASGGALGALGQHATQKLQGKARSPSWDPEERPADWVQEDVTSAATARLDGFLSDMRQQPGESRPFNLDAELHPAASAEGDRALQALADQGRAIDQLNATPLSSRKDAPYADSFAARADQEADRLDAAARDADAQARDFYRSMERQDERIRIQLQASRALGVPMRKPLPASSPSLPPAGGTAVAAAGTANAKPPGRPDHCPNGAFKCPNGRPWPKCTHAEKYRCPPAEHAAEAARHNHEADKGSNPVTPKP